MRLQLRNVVRLAASVASMALAQQARAESPVVVRGASEVAAYQDSDAVRVITPSIGASIENPTAGYKVGGAYLVDVVSAASVDIVSTASRRWVEVRQAGGVDASFKPKNFGVGASAAASVEPDYVAYAAGGSVTQDLDEKNVNLRAGYTFGKDTLGRHGTSFDVFSRKLDRHAANIATTFVLDSSTLLALIGDAVFEVGDQSKPYRYVPTFSPALAPTIGLGASVGFVNQRRNPERLLEQLPTSRQRFAVTARLAHRFGSSTLRAEERGYADSWSMLATTTDVRWLFDTSPRVTLGPHLRFHGQRGVSFWERAYVASGVSDLPKLRTGDRELGPLWTGTGGGFIEWHFGPQQDPRTWTIGVHADAMWTSFLDDLYITNRLGVLAALSLETTW
jgi:hypothetical protein